MVPLFKISMVGNWNWVIGRGRKEGKNPWGEGGCEGGGWCRRADLCGSSLYDFFLMQRQTCIWRWCYLKLYQGMDLRILFIWLLRSVKDVQFRTPAPVKILSCLFCDFWDLICFIVKTYVLNRSLILYGLWQPINFNVG